jgi:hypothetical protein
LLLIYNDDIDQIRVLVGSDFDTPSKTANMKNLPHLNRRRFLQGVGVTLSLPAFESFAGGSSNRQNSPRRLVCVGNHLGFYPGNFFPKTEG